MTDQPSAERPTIRRAVLLLAFLALLPFLPALLRGEVLTFRDHADYFVPLRWFTTQGLRGGSLPLWNPFNGCGESWIGNPQTAIFYPPALIFLLLPFSTAMLLFLAAHLCLLGVFCTRLFSRFASPRGALFGGVIAMLGGPTLSLLDVQNNLLTLCWLPYALDVATDGSLARGKRLALLAIGIAMMFLGGEPFLTAVGIAIVVAASLIVQRRRGLLDAFLATLLGLALAAPQLLAFVQALRGSDRAAGLPPELALQNSTALRDWLALVVPAWWAGPLHHITALSQQFVPSLFIGSIALALAVLTLFRARTQHGSQRQVVAASVATIIGAVLFAAGSQIALSGRLILLLHLNVSRYPSRVIPLAAIALAALAALGWDQIAHTTRSIRLLLVLFLGAFGAAAIALLGGGTGPAFRLLIALDTTLAIVLVLFAPRVFERSASQRLLYAVVTIELLGSAAGFFPSAPLAALRTSYSSRIDRRFNVARLLEAGDHRMAFDTSGKRRWMTGYLNLLHGVHDLSTPAPIISTSYLQLHDEALSGRNRSLTNALSAGSILTVRSFPFFERLGGSAEVNLYRNHDARPMVTLWEKPSRVRTDADAATRALSSDARSMLFVTGSAEEIHPSSFLGAAEPRFIGTNEVEVSVTAERPALVMLNQTDTAGWRVSVDRHRARSIRVNGLFRGVEIGSGAHQIRWTFEPPLFRPAVLLSLLTMLGLAMLLTRRRVRESGEVSTR